MRGFFRDQVIERQRHRLHGSVVIDTPVSARVVTFVSRPLLVAVIGFPCLLRVSRPEEVTGHLMPDMGMQQLTTPQRGVVVDVPVRPEQVVAARSVIAVLSGERTTAKGQTHGPRLPSSTPHHAGCRRGDVVVFGDEFPGRGATALAVRSAHRACWRTEAMR